MAPPHLQLLLHGTKYKRQIRNLEMWLPSRGNREVRLRLLCQVTNYVCNILVKRNSRESIAIEEKLISFVSSGVVEMNVGGFYLVAVVDIQCWAVTRHRAEAQSSAWLL